MKPPDSDSPRSDAKSPTPEPTLQEQLTKTIYEYMGNHGNTISQWKNNNYDYAQTLPETEQEEIVPELITALVHLIEKAERKARLEELEKVKLVEETYWQSDEEEPQDTTNYIDERIKTLKGEEN